MRMLLLEGLIYIVEELRGKPEYDSFVLGSLLSDGSVFTTCVFLCEKIIQGHLTEFLVLLLEEMINSM